MTSPAQDIARIEVAVVTDADMIAAQATRIAELEAALRETLELARGITKRADAIRICNIVAAALNKASRS